MGEICNWLVTGDKHSHFDGLLDKLYRKGCASEETAIVILGDSGLNFWRGRDRGSYKMDEKLQQTLEDSKYRWYILRGNHDQRPETIPGTYIWYDDERGGGGCGRVTCGGRPADSRFPKHHR